MLNKDGDMTGPDIAALSRHPMVNTTATVVPSHRIDTTDVVLRARWHQLTSEKYDCLYLTVRPHVTVGGGGHWLTYRVKVTNPSVYIAV